MTIRILFSKVVARGKTRIEVEIQFQCSRKTENEIGISNFHNVLTPTVSIEASHRSYPYRIIYILAIISIDLSSPLLYPVGINLIGINLNLSSVNPLFTAE